ETDMDGIADLVVGELDAAIDELNQAAVDHPRAETFSDLSAAYLRRFVRQGRTPDAEAARSMAERAISASPTLAEPYFNQAWALETLKRNDDAVSAWRQYLTVDGSSLWADEARRHLDDLVRAR